MGHLRFLALGLLLACAGARGDLPTPVAARLQAAGIPPASAAVLVLRPDGSTLISHNPDKSLQSGSTVKLITSLAGLELLGPAWKGRTEMLAGGEVRDGVLQGDLILRGGADADLDWETFRRLLQTLRARGLREVHGDLLLDRSHFDPPRIDLGLPPFDESPELRYNLIPDALLLNQNLLRVEMAADDRSLALRWEPPLPGVKVESAMTLSDRPCRSWDDGWQSPAVTAGADGSVTITLRGDFPRQCVQWEQLNVLDRRDYADRLFRGLWTSLGGSFTGVTREAAAPAAASLLAEHVSRPLAEVAQDINKRSDNALTRLLFLSLGADRLRRGQAGPGTPTLVAGEQAVRRWLKDRAIADDGLVLENGSGLSRSERVTARLLATLLRRGLASPWTPEYLASLPLAGLDGSLAKRLQDSPAAGRARLKTGSLRNAASLAGYAPNAAGEMCIVVGILNDDNAKGAVARSILDSLVDWVGRQ